MKYLQEKKKLGVAATKSGMDEKTARKYRDIGKLPSELKAERVRTWRTREDPFEGVWERVKSFLENIPAWKQRRCLSICSGSILVVFQTVKFGPSRER